MDSVVERKQHLRLVLENLQAAHQEWSESDRQALFLDDPFAVAVDEVLDVFQHGDLPGGFQPLFRTVDQLRQHWSAYGKQLEGNHNPYSVPGNGFWKTLEHLFLQLATASKPQRKTLESIADLRAQKVSDRQICVIYGWVEDDGTPQVWKLAEEIKNPGTHTGKDFVPPHERAHREREKRQQEILRRLIDRRNKKLKSIKEPGPESIEDLIHSGVSVEQIAKIKRCSIEDVYALCREKGLPPPQERYETRGRGVHDPELTSEQESYLQGGHRGGSRDFNPDDLDEDDELGGAGFEDEDESATGGAAAGDTGDLPTGAMTLEQEIVHYHQQGLKPGDIAKSVSQPDREVSLQRVNAVLKRFGEDPSAFTA